ncbi:putative ABC transporter permease [Treponema sp. Marseille-Q3903]|uniref:putative ABC transporter permease n=1 Tax=Treponema sp. Marseille-Q3903 TaxID=2766703 RepID=UPI0016526C29|nr:putative ABC transporter permease [Treponema sp. Marseille-Q3903]MBC6714462.1 putative ABC transporter permease [Treponema sp. Marseille-Q3903]
MNIFLIILFLFFAGSIIGWSLEVLWRHFFSKNNPEHKWINPGFLVGPYLPLYGFSLTILFLLSFIDVSFIENKILQKAILFVCMALSITVFEYIAGLIFIKGMKIKLWDYSRCWGNIQGIICPLYTFFWYILSTVYYFFIHPRVLNWLYWFTNHLTFCLVVGFFYGVFAVDVFYSLNIMKRIRKFAKENGLVVRLENLQQHIRRVNDENKEKVHFWLSTKSEYIDIKGAVLKLKEKVMSEKKDSTENTKKH